MIFTVVGIVAATVFSGGQMAIADFVICDPKPVDEAINYPGGTFPSGFSFLPDGLKLYFAQNRTGYTNARALWVIERESTDAPWGAAVNLGPNVNTPDGRGSPAIFPDDLELYFTVWSSAHGQNIVMRSARDSTDEPWGPAMEFTGLGDALDLDFTPDGLSVYFWSRRSGGYGGRDIWVSTRATTEDYWGEAVNLGPNVNDSGNQHSPSISNDGLALFFVNWPTRRILMCIRATTDDDWSPAIDLGPAVIGQASWVARPEICPDGSTLYFDSSEGLFRQVSIKPVVDFDDNGTVEMDDLLTMIGAWGTDEQLCDIGPMPWGDGVVDQADLEVLMEHWGEIKPIIVDNFESYDDDTEAGMPIWETWIDGLFVWTSGSMVGYVNPPFAETLIVHTGAQAMPFFYDNDGTLFEGEEDEVTGVPYYSETQRTWAEPQDWTRRGVEVLTLWFYGEPDNSPDPFYVALEDGAGNRKDITHPDPAVLTVNDWQQWRIPLANFTDVDPTAIKIMYIGVGDPTGNQPGGSGLVRIDDIELHHSSGQ
jgi:hypothetical protein